MNAPRSKYRGLNTRDVTRRRLGDEKRMAVHFDVRVPQLVLKLHPAAHFLTYRSHLAGGGDGLTLVAGSPLGNLGKGHDLQ